MSRAWRRRVATEDGSVVTAPVALLMFLVLLLVATQVAVHLYATSISTSVLFDVARKVATATTTGAYDCPRAEDEARRRLGRWGREELLVACGRTATHVVIRAAGPSPANLVAGFGSATGLATFEREVRVRTERLVP